MRPRDAATLAGGRGVVSFISRVPRKSLRNEEDLSVSVYSFNAIFAFLAVPSPFRRQRNYPQIQVDIFMALAIMASHKAASSCRGDKSFAEDAWLLHGNKGPIIDPVLWKLRCIAR